MKRALSRLRSSSRFTRRPCPLGISLGRFSSIAGVCGALAAGASSAGAASYYWDGDGSTTGNATTGSFLGQQGIWNSTAPLWWDGASTEVAWPNAFGDTAVFSGPAGVVTLGAPVSAGNLIFNAANYNILGNGPNILTLGNLAFAGSGRIQVDVNGTATIGATIAGNNGLTFSSSTTGTLVLTGNNTFTGGVNIASGTLSIGSDSNLGAVSNNLAFTGTSGGLTITGPFATTRNIDTGTAAVTLTSSPNAFFGGALTGGGSLTIGANTTNALTTFANAGSFNGTVNVQTGTLAIGSLGDTAGAGNLRFGVTGTNNGATLQIANGNVGALVLNNRRIELLSVGAGLTLNSSSATVANTMTINSDIIFNDAGSKTLTLAGSGFGTNYLNSAITNAPNFATNGFTTTLAKNGAGLWVLGSGTESYTGNTNLNQGALRVTGGAFGAGNSTFVLGNQGVLLELRNEADVNYGRTLNGNGQATGALAVIYADRAVGGSGAGKLVTLGAINQLNSTASVTFAADHGYGFSTGVVQARALNGTSSTLTIVNNLGAPGYLASGYTSGLLTLGGIISDAVAGAATLTLGGWGDYAPFDGNISSAAGTPLNLVKSNSGLMTILGNNSAWNSTVPGSLTVSSGTARIIATNTNAIGTANVVLTGGMAEFRKDDSLDFGSRTLTFTGTSTLVAAPLIGSNVMGKTLTFGAITSGSSTSTAGLFVDTNHNYAVTLGTVTGLNTGTFNNIGGGLLTIAGYTTANASTLALNGAGDSYIPGSITGNGALTKSGQGVLTLDGANSIGSITLQAGVLRITNPAALGGTGTLAVQGNAVNTSGLDIRVSTNADFSNRTLATNQYGSVINLDRALGDTTTTGKVITFGLDATSIPLNAGFWSFAVASAHGYGLKLAGAGPLQVGNNVDFALWNFLSPGGVLELATGVKFNTGANKSTVTLSGTGDYLVSGPLSYGTTTQTSGFIKNGAGVLTLSADSSTSFNTALGVLSLSNGVTRVTNGGALGGSSATVNLSGGVLDLRSDSVMTIQPTLNVSNTVVLNVDRAVGGSGTGATLSTGALTGSFTLFATGGGNSGSSAYNLSTGAITLTNTSTIVNNIANGGVLTIGNFAGAKQLTFNGSGSTVVQASGGLGNIIKSGTGTVTFTEPAGFANNVTGGLTVNGGALVADYSAGADNAIFSSGQTLALAGGKFQLKGNANGIPVAQSMGGLTVNAGPGQLVVTPQGSSTTLAFSGAVAANTGSGLLVTTAPGGSIQLGTAYNTAALNHHLVYTNGSGFDWLANTSVGSDSTAYTGYIELANSTGTSDNLRISAGSVVGDSNLAAAKSANSLKIETGTSSGALVLNGTLTLKNGGLLVTGSNDFAITKPVNGAGLIASNNELLLSNYGTGTLTLSAPILNNAASVTNFTIGGTGTTLLGDANLQNVNTYTGTTYVNGGLVKLVNLTRLGAAATQDLQVHGGTLDLNGNNLGVGALIGGVDGHLDNSSATAATLTIGNNYAGTSAAFLGAINNSGSGALSVTKVGSGTINLGDAVSGGSNNFRGDLTIAGGTVSLATLADAAGSQLVFSGGNLTYLGNGELALSKRAVVLSGEGVNTTITSSGIVGANGLAGILTLTAGVTPGASAANDTITLAGTSGVAHSSWVNTIGGIANPSSGGGKTALNVTTTGSWQLTGSNTFTGGITLSAGSSGSLRLTSAASANGNAIALNSGTLELRSDRSEAFNTPLNLLGSATIVADRAVGGEGYSQVMTLGTLTQMADAKTLTFRNAAWNAYNMNGANPVNNYGVRVQGVNLTTGATTSILNSFGTQGAAMFTQPAPGALSVPGALVLDYVAFTGPAGSTHTLTLNSDANTGGVTIINGDITQMTGANANTLALNITSGNAGQDFLILANQTSATNYSGGLTIGNGGNSANTTVRATTPYSLGTRDNVITFARGGLEIRSDVSVDYGNPIVMNGVSGGNLYLGESLNGSGGHNNTFSFGSFTENTSGQTFTVSGLASSFNASGASAVFGSMTANATNATFNNNLLLPGTVKIGAGGLALTTNNTSGTTVQVFGGTGYTTLTGDILDNVGGGKLGLTFAGSGVLTLDAGPRTNYSGGLTISNGTLRAITPYSLGVEASPITLNATLEVRSDSDVTYKNAITLANSANINVGQLPGGTGVTGGQNKLVTLGPVTQTVTAKRLTVAGIGNTLENNGYSVTIPSFTTNVAAATITNSLSLPGLFTLGGIFNTAASGTSVFTFDGTGTTIVTGPVGDSASGALTQINFTSNSILALQDGTSNFSGGLILNNGSGTVRVNNVAGFSTFTTGSQLGSPTNAITMKTGLLDIRSDVDVTYSNPITFDGTGDSLISADRLNDGIGRTVNLGVYKVAIGSTLKHSYLGAGAGYNLNFAGLVNANTAAQTDNRIRNFGSGSLRFGYVRSDSAFAQTIAFDSIVAIGNTSSANNLTIIAGDVTQTSAPLALNNLNGILDVTAVNRNLSSGTAYSGGLAISGGTVIASSGVNFGSNPAVTMGASTSLFVRNDSDATFSQTFSLAGSSTFDVSSAGLGSGHLVSFNTIQPSANFVQTLTFNGRDGYAASIGLLKLMGTTGQTTTVVGNVPVTIGSVVNPMSGYTNSNYDTLTLDGGAGGTLAGPLSDAVGGSATAGGQSRLTKTGGGTWTITAVQNYTGPTTVSAGTLRLGVNNALNDLSTISIGTGAVLDYQSYTDTLGAFSLNGGAITGTGKLTLTNATVTAVGISAITNPLQLTVEGTPATRTFAVTNSTDSLVLSGVLSEGANGVASLVKTGNGVLTLSAATNTYSGGTAISGGTLAIASDASLGAATAPLTFNGGILRILGTAGGGSAPNRPIVFTGAVGIDVFDQANTYTLSSNYATFGNNFTKYGAGTLTFATDVNGNGKSLVVTNGTLALHTAFNNTQVGNAVAVGNTALAAGNGGGALVISGAGSGVFISGVDNFSDSIELATATNSFGSISIGNGGTVTGSRFRTMSGTGLISVLSGGTLSMTNYAISGNAAGAVGVLNIAGGVQNGTMSSGNGAWSGSRYEQNIGVNLGSGNAGGTVDFSSNPGMNFRIVDNNSAGTGIANLITGGTIKANGVVPVGAATAGGRSELNFHGGTLQYIGTATSNTNFISSNLTAVNIFSEGAIINDNGATLTINAPLQAPVGQGVDSINASGSGYFTAPYVKITGGNNDATAVAQIDAAGNITGIIVTNPGTGYTSAPVVTLVGGTNGTAGTATAALNAGNVSGGLTKIGSGTLIFGGNNTFTGALNVLGGTIAIGNGGSLNAFALSGLASRTLAVGTGGSVTVTSAAALPVIARALNGGSVGAVAITSAMSAAPIDFSTDGLNLPTASLGAAGGPVTYTGVVTPGLAGYRLGGGGNLLTFQSVITGANSVTIQNGPVLLTGQNTFTGGFTLAAGGTLQIGSATTTANFGNNLLGLVSQGGTIQWASGSSTDVTSGAGAIANGINFSAGTTVLDTNGNDITLNGPLGYGAGAVSKSVGTGTLTLAGATNAALPYTGTFTISTGAVRLANTDALRNATVSVGVANGLTFAGGIGAFTLGGLSGSNATGNFVLEDTNAAGVTLRVGQNNAGTTYSGVLSGGGNLVKIGTATLILNTNQQTYTGGTTVTGGNANNSITNTGNSQGTSTVQVSFTSGTATNILPTNIFNFGSANIGNLTPGGGVLNLTGAGGAVVDSQSFALTTVAAGFSSVVLANGTNSTANTVTLNLGNLQRTAVSVSGNGSAASAIGGGTINFNANTTGANALTTTTTRPNDATGLLGPWATVGGNDFATNSSGNIVAYTGYSNITTNGVTLANDSSKNVRINAGGTGTTSVAADNLVTELNTLTIAAGNSASSTITIGTSTTASNGVLRLGSLTGVGGILMGSGAGTVTIGNVVNAGTLTAGAGTGPGELLINNASANTGNGITINSTIKDGGAVTLVKTGAGQITLAGTNTYSGGTIIENGRITITNASAFGTGVVTVQPGGAAFFSAALNVANNFNLAGTGIAESTNYGALRMDNSAAVVSGNIRLIGDAGIGTNVGAGSIGGTVSGNITGAYALVKSAGAGRIVLTGTNSYTGQTLISSGVLQFGNGTASHTSYDALASRSVLTSGSGTAYVNTNVAGNFQAFLNTKANPFSTGSFALSAVEANSAVDFATPGLTGAYLSSAGNLTYTGLYTPANNTYRFGGGDGIFTYQPGITGNSAVVIGGGNGTTTFTGTNTYTGGTAINNGTLLLDSLARLGTPAAGLPGLVATGGTVKLGSVFDISAVQGGLNLASGTFTLDTGTLAGASINTPFVNGGNGTFQRSSGNTNSFTIGAVAPTYGWSGGITVNGGVVQLASQQSISPNAQLAVNGNTSYVAQLGADLTVGNFVMTATNVTPTLDLNGHALTYGLNNFNGNTNIVGLITSSVNYGSASLTKFGFGSSIYYPRLASTYSGTTAVRGGLFQIEFNNATTLINTDALSNSGNLLVGGGTFKLSGRAFTGANSQSFLFTKFAAGESGIALASGGTTNTVALNLGFLDSRAVGATVNFTNPGNTLSTTNGIVTTSNNADFGFAGGQASILGGYATVGGNTWAVATNGGSTNYITGLTSYNAGFAAGLDVDAATGASTPAAMTINSLRFNTTGAATVNAAAGLTIASGGLLVTSAVGSANGVSFNGGTLTTGNGADLIIINNNGTAATGAVTINSKITGGSSVALTKAGTGYLVLGNTGNDYGQTFLDNGFLQISALGQLGSGDITITNNGSTTAETRLEFTAAGQSVANNIHDNNARPVGSGGTIYYNGAAGGRVTLSGAIDLTQNVAGSSGHFASAQTTGGFNFTGPITAPYGVTVQDRNGVTTYSGGGDYYALNKAQDMMLLGATDGLSTKAVVNLATNGTTTFDLSGFNQTLIGLTQTANAVATVTNTSSTASTLTLNPGAGQLYTYGAQANVGSIAGKVNLVKNGEGTQVLAGASSFTGAVTLNAGTLALGNTFSLGSPTNTLTMNGGTLDLNSTANPVMASLSGSAGVVTDLGTAVGASMLSLNGNSDYSFGGRFVNGNTRTVTLAKEGAGTLTLTGAAANTGTLAVNNGKALFTADSASVGALKVAATGRAQVQASAINNSKVLTAGSVTIGAGGTLDLTNNALVVDYSGNASPLIAVEGMLRAGFNNGAWDGTGSNGNTGGIVSSVASSDHVGGVSNLTGIGLSESANVGSSFLNRPVDSTSLLLRYTAYGDANLDGVINHQDYVRIDNFVQGTSTISGIHWSTGDFNYDGVIDGYDYALLDTTYKLTNPDASDTQQIIAQHQATYGQSYTTAMDSLAAGGGPASIPEPGSIAMLTVGGLLLGLRRRRQAAA